MNKRKNPLKIILIGPLRREDKPIGGAVRAFEALADELNQDKSIIVKIVSSNLPDRNVFYRILTAALSYIKISLKIPFVDVVALFTTTTSMVKSVKSIGFLAKFFRKPLLLRKFGGISHEELPDRKRSKTEINKINKLMGNFVSLYVPETKYAWQCGLKAGVITAWMPNYRSVPQNINEYSKKCQKFAYVGQIRAEKGIRELLYAAPLCSTDVTIDVYGPLMDGFSTSDFSKRPHINYKGILSPDIVIATLSHYDAFVFPSYHEGEGHPGSLIEAFSLGLPAVTTNWKFIPEVADSSCALLVQPADSQALAQAMNQLACDPDLYHKLAAGAKIRAKMFDIKIWTHIFIQFCYFLANRFPIPSDLISPEYINKMIIMEDK